MKFKSEFKNAVTLFLLLRLLFWTCTWNLTEDFDFSSKRLRKSPKDAVRGEVTVFRNQFSAVIESFSSSKFEKRGSSQQQPSPGSLIPPFNEWKEKEIIKYEKGSWKEKGVSQPPGHLHRRKLNYASSKCGAKVLASNPESRQRTGVLSEKPEEYMLSPCRVQTWFVIELCDSVEATQVEIANYELYSSSPKEFSVFWSDVYPAAAWRLLGNFEAKDERTMQTFDLTAKNLGKFIKVIIYNHHGKEHYCPLSVVRIIGYSMVQKLEQEETRPDSAFEGGFRGENDTHFPSPKEAPSRINASKQPEANVPSRVSSSCSVRRRAQNAMGEGTCAKEPACFFLAQVLRESWDLRKGTESPVGHVVGDVLPERISPNTTKSDGIHAPTRVQSHDSKHPGAEVLKTAKETDGDDVEGTWAVLNTTSERGNISVSSRNNGSIPEETVHTAVRLSDEVAPGKCACTHDRRSQKMERLESQERIETDRGFDSAGLIQKESVLFKLTVRIKTLETDLYMINKYLEELSQSYREQMENMESIFDRTVKAIRITTEKSTTIDKKQDESINMLQHRLKLLNQKTDTLLNGQKDLVKRVLEWHGFFLILEVILMSTVFSLFVNVFYRRRKNGHQRC